MIPLGQHMRQMVDDFIASPEFKNWMPMTPERKAAWDKVFWLRNKEIEEQIWSEGGQPL